MALEVTGAAHLKDWMHRRQLRSQRELAQYLGFDERLISQVLTGQRGPGLRNAIVIERKTGIPVEVWASSELDELNEADTATIGNRKLRKV
jgi:transcriptional regulator with XRE-family HTH domain